MTAPELTPLRRFGPTAALVLVALGLGAAFAWEVRSAGVVAIDDAYITFSYSKNLASGLGPVYGHGVRVEGYSNFLWMVAVAVGLVFQRAADPLMTARVVTMPFLILLGWSTYALGRVRAPRLLALALVALLAINADFTLAYLIGLETIPYAALLAFAFLLYARSLDEPRLRRWVVPAFVAVALMRIDGFVPLGFMLAFEAGRRLWRRDGTLRDYLRWAVPGVAPYLVWFAWRWAYYGLPLPTTYYAKALIPKLIPQRGWEYVRNEVEASRIFVALPFALILLARRRAAGVALALFVPLHLFYVVRAGGDWMPYGRFVLPVFPLALVVIAWGGAELVAAVRIPRRAETASPSEPAPEGMGTRPRVPISNRVAHILWLAPLAALALIARHTERHLPDNPALEGKYAQAWEQGGHVRMLKTGARLLSWAMPPGARLVTDYGGVFAYYTDAAPIEMWGLCNALIATKGGTERIVPFYGRTCPECYPQLDPEFFYVNTPMPRPLNAFHSQSEMLNSIWQTDTIGRYINFDRDFVSGRAMMPERNQAMYFLEKRKPGAAYIPRRINDKVLVDYPFERRGRTPGL